MKTISCRLCGDLFRSADERWKRMCPQCIIDEQRIKNNKVPYVHARPAKKKQKAKVELLVPRDNYSIIKAKTVQEWLNKGGAITVLKPGIALGVGKYETLNDMEYLLGEGDSK